LNNTIWLITIGLIVVFLAVAFYISIIVGQKQQRRDRVHSVISSARGDGFRGNETNKALAKQKAELARKLKEVSDDEKGKKKDSVSLRQMLQQAGIEAPVSQYWIGAAVFSGVVWLALMLTHWSILVKCMIMVTTFFGLPKWFLKKKAQSRQKKFLKEFADALDAMARLLQAGMPMSEAIAMTSREFQGPLKEEMLRVYDNQKIGVAIGEAALMMARRVPLAEVQMFATALQIQSETGSSLSEVLNNLSNVIRARFRLRRKVQALSSEAKSSAAIIGCLPVLVMLALWFARPEYIGLLFSKPTGHIMLGGSLFWMSLGILMMRQMINFRI
jgi:tight adherence protein B